MGLGDLKILIPTCRHDYYKDVKYSSALALDVTGKTCQRETVAPPILKLSIQRGITIMLQ